VAKRYKVILMRYLPLLLLMLAAVPAEATEWRMQSGSEFTFEATFESVASPGRFAADPGAGRLRVTVNLAAADMGDADMNAIIADPIWFDVGNFPQAVYESEQIEARAPGEFVATGVLNLKGISKTVTVPFSWSEQDARANMRGQFVLQRIDFKVGSGEWATGDAIGLDVKLQFDLSLERGD
jgi:polyisoprenoid-binding protein YceI